MNTLTTPIAVANIQKIKVVAVQLDGDLNVATVSLSVQGSGGRVYSTPTLQVRDGLSQGLRATASPLGYQDVVETFTTTTATGFTDLVTAYTGAINARNKAAETALITAGLLPAGAVA
jgi:hypothetical protein